VCVCNVSVTSPFGNSDHCKVAFTTYFEHVIVSQLDSVCSEVYDWNTADFNSMSEYLASVDWCALLTTNLTPDSLWNAFSECLQYAVDMYVCTKQRPPQQKTSSKPHQRPRYPSDVRRAFLAKRSTWRKHRQNPQSPVLLTEYRNANNLCRTLIRKSQTYNKSAALVSLKALN